MESDASHGTRGQGSAGGHTRFEAGLTTRAPVAILPGRKIQFVNSLTAATAQTPSLHSKSQADIPGDFLLPKAQRYLPGERRAGQDHAAAGAVHGFWFQNASRGRLQPFGVEESLG